MIKSSLCLVIILFSSVCIPLVFSQETRDNDVFYEADPAIQIAILLDTSNSMDGLINQAKTQLWKIVNEFATTKKDGQIPVLYVALYEYGKNTLSPDTGYLRMVLSFTTDLDKISEELFALTTNGGQEYCGWVIQSAVHELNWSKSHNGYKAIFIAGNEPFTQGRVDYRTSCREAITRGIIVNTIHCGSVQEGIRGMWQNGAILADGSYMNIDQNRQEVAIQAPQDKSIVELNEELNKTYIPFGVQGRVSYERQKAQDSNAMNNNSENMVQRAMSKSSAHYRNTGWDLVDAVKGKQVKLEEVETKDLPQEMQKMSMEERMAYVLSKEKKRAEIQESIKQLNAQREKYIAEEKKKLQSSGDDTLDTAMIKVLRGQLQKKNYETNK